MKYSGKKLRETKWDCCVWTYNEFNDGWVDEMLEPLENITIFCPYRRIGKLKIKWSSTNSKTKITQERRVDDHWSSSYMMWLSSELVSIHSTVRTNHWLKRNSWLHCEGWEEKVKLMWEHWVFILDAKIMPETGKSGNSSPHLLLRKLEERWEKLPGRAGGSGLWTEAGRWAQGGGHCCFPH